MSGHQYVKRTRAWKRKGEKKKKLMARTNQIEFAEPETTEQMWSRMLHPLHQRTSHPIRRRSIIDQKGGACHGNGMRYNRHELEF
jgi:hypothetical protein